MNRICLSDKEQIKCNFCTKWFTTTSHFARIQRYSINICQNCLINFNYRVVDPESYQIYQIMLIATGSKFNINHLEINKKLEKVLFSQRQQNCISLEEQQQVIKYSMLLQDLYSEANLRLNSILESFSTESREKINKYISSTKTHTKILNSVIEQIQKHQLQFIKQIETTSTREDFIKIQWQKYNSDKFNELSQLVLGMKTQLLNNLDKNDLENQNSYQRYNKKIQVLKQKQPTNYIKQIKKRCIQSNLSKKIISQHQNNQGKYLIKKKETSRSFKSKSQIFDENFDPKLTKLIKSQTIQTLSKFTSRKNSSDKADKANEKSYGKDEPHKIFRKVKSVAKLAQSLCFSKFSQALQTTQDYEKQAIQILLRKKLSFQSFLQKQTVKQDKSQMNNGVKCLVSTIIDSKNMTIINQYACELISNNIGKIDYWCYLKSLEWRQSIKIVRMVKIKMTDQHFDILLFWLSQENTRNVSVLILTNNLLTQSSLEGLINYKKRNPRTILDTVYLGNNFIKPSQVIKDLTILKQLGITVYV